MEPISDSEVEALITTISQKIMNHLKRKGYLDKDGEDHSSLKPRGVMGPPTSSSLPVNSSKNSLLLPLPQEPILSDGPGCLRPIRPSEKRSP